MAFDGQALKKARHRIPAAIAKSDYGKAILREAERFPGVVVTFVRGQRGNVFEFRLGEKTSILRAYGNYADPRSVDNCAHAARSRMQALTGAPPPPPPTKPQPMPMTEVKRRRREGIPLAEPGTPEHTKRLAKLAYITIIVDRTQPHWIVVIAERPMFYIPTLDCVRGMKWKGEVYFEAVEGRQTEAPSAAIACLPLTAEPVATDITPIASGKPDLPPSQKRAGTSLLRRDQRRRKGWRINRIVGKPPRFLNKL